jgi:hypothetical protein
LLELRQRSSVATVLEVAGTAASGRRAGKRDLPNLRVGLPGDLDGGRLAGHRGAPTRTERPLAALTGASTLGVSESRTTLPPQSAQSVWMVGSRKRPLDQSWPQDSQIRVGGFPAIGTRTLREVRSLVVMTLSRDGRSVTG